MRSVEVERKYRVDEKEFPSMNDARKYALRMDLADIVNDEIAYLGPTYGIVEFLLRNARIIEGILIEYMSLTTVEWKQLDPKTTPSEDPASPSPTEG